MGRLARMVLGIREEKKTDEVVVQTKARAGEIVTINQLSYFQELLAQLKSIAYQPVAVGDHPAMIEQVGKQNAYRELLSVLERDLRTAERVLADDSIRQRNS